MAMGEVYAGISGLGNNNGFTGVTAQFKSVCVVTKDQSFPLFTSTTCFYEFEFRFCRPLFIENTDKLEKLYLRKSEVIPEEKVLAVINEIEKGGRRGRRTQERDEEKKLPDIAPKNEDQDEELIEAIQLTAEFAEFSKLNQAVVDQLCPAYGCFIPFYICRQGGFTAHGSGPDHIEITGGTYDLFGAFGQVSKLVLLEQL